MRPWSEHTADLRAPLFATRQGCSQVAAASSTRADASCPSTTPIRRPALHAQLVFVTAAEPVPGPPTPLHRRIANKSPSLCALAPMSAQPPRDSRKRSLPPDQRSPGRADGGSSRYSSSRTGRDDDETPWWEQARGGDLETHQRDSRGSYDSGGRRYDDKDGRGADRPRYDERRYDDRRSSSGAYRGATRGGYDQQRGGRGGGGGAGGRGGYRNDYYDHRATGSRHGFGAEPEECE